MMDDMDDNNQEKHSADEFLEEIHGDAASSVGLEYDLTITEEDIQLYLQRHPYLQLLNLDPTFEDFEEVNILQSPPGWSIQDFGDALSTSQGEFLFHDFGPITLFANPEEEEGEGDMGGIDLLPGVGTVVKQGFDTAVFMVDMIKERWSGVHIVAGSELMKWAAWVAATDSEMDVYGYEADKAAQARHQRLKRAAMQRASAKQPGQSRTE